jgi:hypothetical protein
MFFRPAAEQEEDAPHLALHILIHSPSQLEPLHVANAQLLITHSDVQAILQYEPQLPELLQLLAQLSILQVNAQLDPQELEKNN